MIRGRGFTEQDTATSRMVAVVNQAFVKKFFPKEDPIGRHFGTFDQKYAGDYEIVGIVADAKYNNPREEYRPMYFRPLTQYNRGFKESQMAIAEGRSLSPIQLLFNSRVMRRRWSPWRGVPWPISILTSR